jgi:pheromone a factor receptor
MRVELPIISFICTVLVLIPLPWHWRARNVATVSIIVWLTICNVTRGINAIVWGGSTVVKYHVWCDISKCPFSTSCHLANWASATKLIIGAYIAVPASMMCVCRYLSQVASPRQTIANASDKRRRMIFELVMCVGLPIIGMALRGC